MATLREVLENALREFRSPLDYTIQLQECEDELKEHSLEIVESALKEWVGSGVLSDEETKIIRERYTRNLSNNAFEIYTHEIKQAQAFKTKMEYEGEIQELTHKGEQLCSSYGMSLIKIYDLKKRITELEEALQSDASNLWTATNAIKEQIKSRAWLTDKPDAEEIGILFSDIEKIIDTIHLPAQKRFYEVLKSNPFEGKMQELFKQMDKLMSEPEPSGECTFFEVDKAEYQKLKEKYGGK
jgi:predicted transcriptional regulator